LCLSVEG
jgi:hypothetical protein